MDRTGKRTKRQTIKMVAWNAARRTWEEVFPEDNVPMASMVAMQWSRYMEKFVTTPDCPASELFGKWQQEMGR